MGLVATIHAIAKISKKQKYYNEQAKEIQDFEY